MVQMPHSGSGQYLNGEWHDTRHKARTETFSIEEWGDIDIEKYDLDNVEFTRKQKRSTYLTESMIKADAAADEEGFDIRNIPTVD